MPGRDADLDEATPATIADEAPSMPTELGAGVHVGRYRIVDTLGSGGMGVVYRAYDPQLSRQVALKLLHQFRLRLPDAAELQGRLLREAQALAKLSHPNVVAAYDVGTLEGAVFIAMELIEGVSLREWMREPRSRAELVRVLVGAGRGLAAAHAAGVVHRDFKPANVMVSPDGRPRVVDFGLARAAGEPGASAPALASWRGPLQSMSSSSGLLADE